jgi:hypothetical protein
MRKALIVSAVALAAATPALLLAESDPLAELTAIFKGRVPEAPVECVHLTGSFGLRIVGTTTVILRHRNGLIYRNDPPGGCPAQRVGMQTATNPRDVRLCKGDPVAVVDVERGTQAGACDLGDWIPYRRAQ